MYWNVLREDRIPWKRNRKCSRRMEDSTNLQISQTRVLTDHSVEGQSWEDLWGLSFDLCSPSRGTANVLRPSSPSKLMRDSGRLSNQEQWEVAYRYFPGFSFSSAVESCKEDHKPCHHECGSHCPQTRKSRSAELSES